MRGLLLFLAGLLVGANVVYFLVNRECPTPATTAATPSSVSAPTTMSAPRPAAAPPSTPTQPLPVATTQAIAPPAIAPAAGGPPDVLSIPVAGILPNQLRDTFNDTRDGTRVHEALDIMAARDTQVLAASDGKIVKLFTSAKGGLTIYEFNPGATYAYYYAHLDRYAPGVTEGMAVRRGDLIGYVGSSGDASPDAPHLHFAIFLLGPEKQWWKGTPINPYPLLTATH